jgi:hypothetical protein
MLKNLILRCVCEKLKEIYFIFQGIVPVDMTLPQESSLVGREKGDSGEKQKVEAEVR